MAYTYCHGKYFSFFGKGNAVMVDVCLSELYQTEKLKEVKHMIHSCNPTATLLTAPAGKVTR